MRLVLASNNLGKVREFSQLLSPLGLDVRPQGEFGVGEADEPHGTFLENALVKARHASRLSGLPALADDSGLCVVALDGAPGVLSARYAGEPKSDERNNAKLLAALVNSQDRRAYYACLLVLVRHVDDPLPIVCEGIWSGEIAPQPKGSGGFGYDPLFWLPDRQVTAAELTATEKNRLSHRGMACADLLHKLKRFGIFSATR